MLRHISKSQPSLRRGSCYCLYCPDFVTVNTCRQFLLPSSSCQLAFALSPSPMVWGWEKAQGLPRRNNWLGIVLLQNFGKKPFLTLENRSMKSDGWRANHKIPLKLRDLLQAAVPGIYRQSVLNKKINKAFPCFEWIYFYLQENIKTELKVCCPGKYNKLVFSPLDQS